ncbi:unnamed protein product [Mytilus coruscus]|uniref:C2H2-type domain-containing protein n=1 Tax=Mytilus coruscus TaxID=42192 RepID=A0A6J8C0E3_MYTCO|nr:unnamed protein product [Mytilus coruscus]
MSDFLSWDQDIDLDLLLGEYTKYDPEPSDSDEECYNAKKKKLEPVPDACNKPSYSCPVCKKTLKTISGFRGHVQKQHGQNLRATDHRTHADSKLPSTVRDSLNESSFAEIFPTALQSSLSNIANDPFTINDSITDICKFVTNSALVQDILLKYFQHIFVVPTSNISSSCDREQMFRRLHISRVNPELTKTFHSYCPSHSLNSINLFLQMVHEDIVGEIFKVQTMTAVQKSTTDQEKLTENDQSILYYIAGYTIRALQKRYTRYSTKKLSVINKFTDNSSCVNFVKRYDKWYKTQDRGGLQKPSDSLFLLIRELETVIRKTVQPSYSASSLLIDPLKEAMMEAFMVKHYCDILIQGETADIVSAITEDIIHLFLTIRGFAVTRIERNKLTKKEKSQPSSSLRQALKEKSLNC